MNTNANPPMTLLIIGANGGIGSQTLKLALSRGHRVIAVVRNPANLLLTDTRLTVVKGNIFEPHAWKSYLSVADVVVSAIGKTSLKPTTLYSAGNRQLIRAMLASGCRRIFFISAAGIQVNSTHPWILRVITKQVLQRILKQTYRDLEVMETMIREYGAALDWTILRPPRLVNRQNHRPYRYALNKQLDHCTTISRTDVAHFMLTHIFDEATYRAIVEIAY